MNNRPCTSQIHNVQKFSRSPGCEKATSFGSQTSREKKLTLLEDVDKLKKKLTDEENIHKALKRAFNRPVGALSRLPPYLPPNTQELLAELAVLEEEITRLEEQAVNYRQDLYQEAVFICSKKNLDNPMDYFERITSQVSRDEQSDSEKSLASVARTASTSSDQSSLSLGRTASTSSDIVSDQIERSFSDSVYGKRATNEPNSLGSLDNGKGSEVQTHGSFNRSPPVVSRHRQRCTDHLADWNPDEHSFLVNSSKKGKGKENQTRSLSERLCRVKTPVRKSSLKRQPSQKSDNSPRKQPVNKALGGDSEPNKISEDIMKCLCSIFTKLSNKDDKKTQVPFSLSIVSDQDMELQDPYGSVIELKKRDIGVYKHLCIVDAISIDLKRKRDALFLLHKLKLLLGKLARVNLDGLSHQHKLAFWINTYNSCMMNAFLEHGIPDSAEKVVLLMREATINVGGEKLTAISIEHFILRLPFYVKQGGKRAAKGNDLRVSNLFGLECAEPLVTFALCCGSWSSPAVRVYTASQIESELEVAKKEYIQAAVGISKDDKLTIPKTLDWYQLDFGKDLKSLLDWVCLQLPDELKGEALCCLKSKTDEPVSELIEVVPYDFSFRYLIHS
ncbi:uncharacterized protein LOC141611757 isoform X2 [Silene latifolia]|uniref:uncharacterized protein LOC141611757 isoform X2 n=1 Tax=Silene latifolia TaxID=37657 RepID=UPI003D775B19